MELIRLTVFELIVIMIYRLQVADGRCRCGNADADAEHKE